MDPLAGILNEAWRMYKAFAQHLITVAAVIFLVAAVIAALLALAGDVGVLLGFVVQLFAMFLLEGALVKAVQDIRDGRADLSWAQTISAARPSLWPVATATILASIAIMFGLFLLIIPGLFLLTIWAVVVPVIVIEQSGTMDSFGRSQEIVRGHGWNVFGTLVLVVIVQFLVKLIFALIFSALPIAVSTGLSTFLPGAVIAPFVALVVTLIYYRLTGQDPEAPSQRLRDDVTGAKPSPPHPLMLRSVTAGCTYAVMR